MNEKIVASAFKAITGELAVENSSNGWCLKVVRQIVQDALDIDHGEFYRRYLKTKAVGTSPTIPYARDVQLTLRQMGWGVTEAEPGDLFFSYKPMPYGHTGIFLTPNIVVENTGSKRPFAKRGFLGITLVKDLNMPIEIMRLRE